MVLLTGKGLFSLASLCYITTSNHSLLIDPSLLQYYPAQANSYDNTFSRIKIVTYSINNRQVNEENLNTLIT